MRNRNQTMLITTLSIVLLLFVVFAASSRNKTPGTQPKATPQSQLLPGTPKLNLGGTNTQNGILNNKTGLLGNTNKTQQTKFLTKNTTLSYDEKRAVKINEQVRKMQGVKSCATTVSGNTAIIGCQFTNNVKDKATKKALISKKVKALDKTIKNCKVSNSTDIISRINKITKETRSGIARGNANSEFKLILRDIAKGIK